MFFSTKICEISGENLPNIMFEIKTLQKTGIRQLFL